MPAEADAIVAGQSAEAEQFHTDRVVTISAGNVSAIAAFTTAEDIIIDGAVRSFKRTNDPERPFEFTKVTGDTDVHRFSKLAVVSLHKSPTSKGSAPVGAVACR